jgi:RNA polymerase sigma factor FliA
LAGLAEPLEPVRTMMGTRPTGEPNGRAANRSPRGPYLTFDDFRARHREPNIGVQLRLVERVQQGDQVALESVLISLAPFIGAMVSRHSNPMTMEERKAVGRAAAIDALGRYDPSKGKLTTHLGGRILGAIIDEERGHIRADGLGRQDYKAVRGILEAVKEIKDPEEQRRVLSDELHGLVKAGLMYAPQLVIDGEIVSGHNSWQHVFYAADRDDGFSIEPAADYNLHEVVERRMAKGEAQRIREAIAGLSEREQAIAAHSLFPESFSVERLTLRALGDMFGVSESRVSQIRTAIVKKLTTAPGAE